MKRVIEDEVKKSHNQTSAILANQNSLNEIHFTGIKSHLTQLEVLEREVKKGQDENNNEILLRLKRIEDDKMHQNKMILDQFQLLNTKM